MFALSNEQILEALARNDDMLVQMCGRLSSSCDVIPEELQVRFSAMCGDRVEHINRRTTNYRKVISLSHALNKETFHQSSPWAAYCMYSNIVQSHEN